MRRRGFLLSALLGVCACSSDDEAAPTPDPFPEKDRGAEASRLLTGPDWYRHAVFYEVFVRSLQDSDGDGIGDFKGLTSRLDDIKQLGADALWLMPMMPTPFKDSGYDVADYQDINPEYGTLADFDEFLQAAHDRGMRVFIDLVLNHTSDQHAWFQESRTSKTNPKADWYVWSDSEGASDNGCGTNSPIFGSSPWTFDATRGQYYFHRFYPEQPDLNYKNPEVVKATLDAARFWLDRGVDGFRCDVIALLFESATECDMLPETRDYIRQLRSVLDEYPDRAMVAESSDFNSSKDYFGDGSDMFHIAFNFAYGYFWGFQFGGNLAAPVADVFSRVQSEYPAGAQDGLVIGSHDVARAYKTAQGIESRQRRAALIQLTMRGTPFIYYGEELGLRPGSDVVVDTRDSARTPMLWSGGNGFGFTTGTPWIGFGADADATNLEAERGQPSSTYEYYRALLALRRGREAFGTGELRLLPSDNPSLLVYTRASSDETYLAAVSFDENDAQTATLSGLTVPAGAPLMFGDGELTPDGDNATLTLPAAGFAVLRLR